MSLWEVFFWHNSQGTWNAANIQQECKFSGLSLQPGSLWAALLADVQVCSGCEPWRYQHGGETDPVSTGCSSCPTALLKGLQGDGSGSCSYPTETGKGGLGSLSLPAGSGIFTFPQSPAPILAGITEGGRQRFTTGHKKIAHLLGLLRRTQKWLFCKSQRSSRLAQTKVGCSALSGNSTTITLLYHLWQGLAVCGACLFLGNTFMKLFYRGFTAIRFCLYHSLPA